MSVRPTDLTEAGPSDSRSLARAQLWAVLNTLATIALIAWNYIGGTGLIFEQSIGDISDRYQTAFTPADYAFSIWGLIFTMQLIFCAHQLKRAFVDGPRSLERVAYILLIGPIYLIAQIACGAWLVAWLNEAILGSLEIMIVLFAALMTLIVRLNLERDDPPWGVIGCVWWPISIYAGWISVALLANFSSWLYYVGAEWTRGGGWALGLGVLLSGFHIFMVFSRNMREFSMVAVWALIALAVRYLRVAEPNWAIAGPTLGLAALLVAASGYHACRNFTMPPPDMFGRKPRLE